MKLPCLRDCFRIFYALCLRSVFFEKNPKVLHLLTSEIPRCSLQFASFVVVVWGLAVTSGLPYSL